MSLRSRTFPFTGTIGRSAFPDAGKDWAEIGWATTPWEKDTIRVVGVTLDLNVTGGMSVENGPCVIAGFVGTNMNPDQLTPTRRAVCFRPGQEALDLCVEMMFPVPLGFDLPGKNHVNDPTQATSPGHLDCHVYGTMGLEYAGSITVFYLFATTPISAAERSC